MLVILLYLDYRVLKASIICSVIAVPLAGKLMLSDSGLVLYSDVYLIHNCLFVTVSKHLNIENGLDVHSHAT